MGPQPATDLRALLLTAAAEIGSPIDVARALRALDATVRAFKRRRTAAEPPSVAVERRRLRRLVTAADAMESALARLGRDGRAALDAWASPADCAAWRSGLARLAASAEAARDRAERPARRGGRRDEATRRLALEVAWILQREGLSLSTYEDGLLARVARAVGDAADRRLPADEGIRRFLRPAVRFCRRQGVNESPSGTRFNDLTEDTPARALSTQTRHDDVTH